MKARGDGGCGREHGVGEGGESGCKSYMIDICLMLTDGMSTLSRHSHRHADDM